MGEPGYSGQRELVPTSRAVLLSLLLGEAKMFAGYIFDVEGTLVDSVPKNLRSRQEALERAALSCISIAAAIFAP